MVQLVKKAAFSIYRLQVQISLRPAGWFLSSMRSLASPSLQIASVGLEKEEREREVCPIKNISH